MPSKTTNAPSFGPSPKHPNVKLGARLSQDRGMADHGWLKSFHTFSFASYYSPAHNGFGPLTVINEDRVSPGQGFGRHSHSEMEIFSYVVSGELEHKDSMGNLEIMKRGDVQMTSAGTGIAHSEYNRNKKKPVHFLQIWVEPSQARLPPKYYTRHFTDAEKENKLVQIVAPLPSTSSLELNSSLSAVVDERELEGARLRKGYIHIIQTSGYNTKAAKGATVRVNGGLELSEGDGAFVTAGMGEKLEIENISTVNAELLVFDIE